MLCTLGIQYRSVGLATVGNFKNVPLLFMKFMSTKNKNIQFLMIKCFNNFFIIGFWRRMFVAALLCNICHME
jgi:hypothetical protein